jgi:beta-glucosidase
MIGFTKNAPFLWGAATSGHQVEGQNDRSDWWKWENEGRCKGGARSGAATDHWNRFREDLELASGLGLNSYRFSIEWSRIEPDQGRWDPSALDWYRELILECEKRGLVPMATLHHFTSPAWFAEIGGWASPGAAKLFARFAEKVAQELGARVPLWCTLNEPMVLVVGSYLGRFMPPAEFSPIKASMACHQLLSAHAKAYDILHKIERREGPWKERPLEVGIAHNMLDFVPDRRWHPMENLLRKVFWNFYNRSWLDAITGGKQRFGIPFLLPRAEIVKAALGRRTTDFIGVNYYTKAYVQWRPRAAAQERPAELPIGLSFARRKELASDVEWAIHPEGLGKMLRFVRRYGLPVYITENGIADREDKIRPGFLKAHLNEIRHALADGIRVRGYYHWSLLDNFEWSEGFGPRFGLFHVDYETFKRTPTGTAAVYRELIATYSGQAAPKER